MDSETKISVKNSIAARMLVVVLGLYLLIAVCVTSSHVWMEYNNQKSNIIRGLGDIESAFNKGLAVSLWGLDQESLAASVKGMLKIPTLVGIKIITDEVGMVAIGGIVTEQGEAVYTGLHVNISGLSDTDKAVHKDQSYNLEMFERQFPILYELDGKSMLLGRAIIYSNSSVIYQRMKLQVAMLGINVALTLITFSLALWWAINRYLRKPLVDLASSAEKVTLDNLDSYKVNIETSGQNELKVLEESFNAMIGNLNQSMAQRKQAEEALGERDVTFRKLFEESSDAILLIDCTGVFVECNQAALELLKMSREQFLLLHPSSISPEFQPDGRRSDEAALDMIAQAYRKGLHRFDWTCVNAEGSEFIVEVSLMPITLRGQTMLHTSWRDITERKQAEEERHKLEQQILHAQKLESLGVLAGGIAHDFNNILTAIMGNISSARMDLGVSQHVSESLARAERATKRAAGLAKQLLVFAKGGAPIKKIISLRQTLNDAVSLVLSGTNVQAVIDLPSDMYEVNADEGQLSQTFDNIIINAFQAMPDGGKLTISAKNVAITENNNLDLAAGDYVQLSFADEGCGIAKENVGKIFDPYYTSKADGSGLGLASTFAIIKKHSGHISVSSSPGKGATFTILIPGCSEPVNEEMEQVHLSGCTQRAYSILVMDDDEMVRELAEITLNRLGYKVVCCRNGAEAVSLYRSALDDGVPFSLVIMDLTIPGGMGGVKAARQVLALNPEAQLVVSSGYSDAPVMANFAEYGFCAALEKPYNVAEIARILSNNTQG